MPLLNNEKPKKKKKKKEKTKNMQDEQMKIVAITILGLKKLIIKLIF